MTLETILKTFLHAVAWSALVAFCGVVNYLDGEIRKGLGHYPAWAARWCRMSGLEMEE